MSSVNRPHRATAALGAGRVAALAVGDAIALMVFAAIGRASHSQAAGLDAIVQVAETASPFIIGWFAAAPLFGAYGPAALNGPRAMLARTALTWLVAWPIGLGLRAIVRQSGVPISFALVTFVTVLVIMSLWRGAFALLAARQGK